jgi:uncharacterized protein
MKIGVLSDTHDNETAVDLALREFKLRGVELVVHCGDIQSPSTVQLFADLPAHFVLGNCDWQPDLLASSIDTIDAKLHQPFGELEISGVTVGWVHSHDARLFSNLELSNRFDYLFYGHTHKAEQHRSGKTLVVNPGALYRVRQKTCIVLDLKSGELEAVEIN